MTNLNAQYRLLRKDPILKKVIGITGKLEETTHKDVYRSLLQSITSKQLSTKAGDTIFGRFLDLFPQRNPIPEQVMKMNIEKMRTAGLSYAKAGYLKNIAEFDCTHGLEYRKLKTLADDELMEYLTSIKGVGRWTAEMILMFTLNRPDILPVDDIGIRNEMRHLYYIKGEGKIFIENMKLVAETWSRYRTLASRHIWKYRDSSK
ncbi:MAG: DNA-3-methyladenine glycosylase 2 family protein [Bacteroidetes bacterium]|nr:DNA-3-methyladenine glycosylase 2 family protein [Bacteroidota bacterium]